MRDVSESKRHEAELERHATVDPLTGLLNRSVFRPGEWSRWKQQAVEVQIEYHAF
jgi:GGDEF domain-containing protein